MPPVLRWFIALALVGSGAIWWITRSDALPADALAGLTGDATRGAAVFWAAGCASCHVAPEAETTDAPVLAGGMQFVTPYGTFIAPNISTDLVYGIGSWSDYELANAITRGISPEGQHYYPAFPYDSYNKATLKDVADLVTFLRTLPASDTPSLPHDVGFPFNIRRSLGAWKSLYMSDEWAVAGDLSPQTERGRYLSEALSHCGACHTPRDPLGGPRLGQWLAGAANPSGPGRIPNITPSSLDWTEAEIADYLSSGFTPAFDTAGGHMVAVIENYARLPDADRTAVAAYLKAVPPVE